MGTKDRTNGNWSAGMLRDKSVKRITGLHSR